MNLDDIRQYLEQFDREKLWIIYIFAIIFTALLVDLIQKRVLSRVQARLEKTSNPWDDALVQALRRPVSLLIWIIGLSLALQVMQITAAAVVREVGIMLVIAWTVTRFISFMERISFIRRKSLVNLSTAPRRMPLASYCVYPY